MSRSTIFEWSGEDCLGKNTSDFWNDELSESSENHEFDVYKSFNLIPTPPISPEYSESYTTDLYTPTELLNRNLIQDCMWPSDHLKGQNITFQQSLLNNNISSDIKEPLPMFPYPMSDSIQYQIFTPLNKEDSAETPSDSEDEEDDEIDVVTVEKPYQTSCSFKKQILPAATSRSAQVAEMHSYSSPITIASQRANAPLYSYSMSMRGNSHNTIIPKSLKRNRFISKRIRKHSALRLALKTNVSKYNCDDSAGESSGSRVSSDCEEQLDCMGNGVGKRGQHNLLERRRRDDLKSSFHRLRDIIPDVKRMERTPKVTILRKASDHILSTKNQQIQMSLILEKHKVIQNRLRNKIFNLSNINKDFKKNPNY